ncbi:MAG TPA: Gfo/Idh/MocA family oxidoreductase [Bryobacteraceae bacterium]|jgi:predicted dehydrogenase|nr:Gfo/Idh/MocA family oxidoreductase [Bryobacteraceae bacterium]
MRKVKAAVIGTGFMGRVHSEAIRRVGHVDLVAIAGTREHETAQLAEAMGVERHTTDYRQLIEDKSIDAVHICTPNALHHPIAMAAMKAGKAVLCEKPLTMNAAEAHEMVQYAEANGIPNCVNHNLRYYPVVQHIRRMVESGELGDILVVQGTYSQDWLLYDTDYNWRIEAKDNGPLRVMGDIGSHWMDMIQHLTGLKISALCADLATIHPTRKRPKVAIETFAGKTLNPADYEQVKIETEDFGSVLLHLGDRARGSFTVSQVSAGCKNKFAFEIFGTKCGVGWNQERPDELWIGHRNSPNELLIKDPSLLLGDAKTYADLPGGHSEGYDDTHKQVFKRFYSKVANPSAPVEYPVFAEGLWGMHLLEKVLESHQSRSWITT